MRARDLLSITIEQMRKDACHARHQGAYETAKARQPSMGSYCDMESLLTALKKEPDQNEALREPLTRALLQEHRAGNGEAWRFALFTAYCPMLKRLRRRVRCAWEAEDVDQMVLTAFTEALDWVKLEGNYSCTFLLRQQTARRTFRRLHSERSGECEISSGDYVDMEDIAPTMEEADCDGALIDAMLSAAGESADLLLCTVSGGESLRDYVERTVVGDVATRHRAYERLKHQRERALTRLRKLADVPLAMSA